jgi:hypothetical protein
MVRNSFHLRRSLTPHDADAPPAFLNPGGPGSGAYGRNGREKQACADMPL